MLIIYSRFLWTNLLMIFCAVQSRSQLSQEWTWLGGDKNVDQLTKANYPGGRSGSSIWIKNETAYMFGGNGFSDISTGIPHLLNDIWTFDTISSKFKLMQPGSFSANGTDSEILEIPESRQHAAMCGNNDKLFLFGGFAKGGRSLSDLWSFDLSLGKWTKLSNWTITPSARGHSSVWCFNSSMYLFGGLGDKTVFNDMWVFNLSSVQWRELQGLKNLTGLEGNFVYPWGRNGAATWVSGNDLYMFGGNSNPLFSYTLYQKIGLMSDLWKYLPASNEWYYVFGPTFPGKISVLNGVGTTVDSNLPGSRISAASWTDSRGHLWLFAGAGADVQQEGAYHFSKLLADLWRFHVKAGGWAFMGGSKLGDIQGNYDDMKQKQHTSYPGARTEMMVWKVRSNKAFIFGGLGHDGKQIDGYMNDLWLVDFSATTEEEYLISALSLFVFVGLGSASLFLVLIFVLCSKQNFAVSVRRLHRVYTARYRPLINQESMF